MASNSAVAATSTPMLKLQIEGNQRTSTCRSGDSAATEFVFAYTVVVGTHLKVNAWYSALIKSFWRRDGSHRNGQQQRERKRAGLVLMIGALGATVCGGSDEPELPDTTAASVLAYLEEVDYRESWELWPGRGEKYQGDDPHGILLTTYLNPAAYDALDSKAGIMPDGAVVVKENYIPEGSFAANTVTYKKSGYNPDHNDWFCLKVLADGTVEKEGMVEGCQTCHGDARDNDYIWTGPLR